MEFCYRCVRNNSQDTGHLSKRDQAVAIEEISMGMDGEACFLMDRRMDEIP